MAGYVYLGHRFIGYHYGTDTNTFAGLTLAPADCYLDSNTYNLCIDTLVTTPGPNYYLNTHDSFNSSYDTGNSTYFTRDYICNYFGYDSQLVSGNLVRTVNNQNKVIDTNGTEYRVATKNELDLIFVGSYLDENYNTISRMPAVIDGEYTAYSAAVAITSGTGITTNNAFAGILVYPDSKELTGVPYEFTSGSQLNQISLETLISAIEQGAVFIRHNGVYYTENGSYVWTRCGDGTTRWYSVGNNYDNFTFVTEVDYYDSSYHNVVAGWYNTLSQAYRGYTYPYNSMEPYPYALPLRLVSGTMTV